MFGYIRTDPAYLYGKDDILYRAFYCGLCKSIGKSCGQRARFALNYDLTFLSAFAHNVCGEDVQIERQRCVMHWFRKRPMAGVDALSVRVAHLTVILTARATPHRASRSPRRRTSYPDGFRPPPRAPRVFLRGIPQGARRRTRIRPHRSRAIRGTDPAGAGGVRRHRPRGGSLRADALRSVGRPDGGPRG